MKWLTYISPASGQQMTGVLAQGEIRALPSDQQLLDILIADALEEASRRAIRRPAEVVAAHEVELLPPIPRPPSLRDFFSFEQHVVTCRRALGQDMDPRWYASPAFYFSNPAALIGDGADAPLAPGSHGIDYELEVAAVIGRPGSNVDPARAEGLIAGYAVLNDWSARDLQASEMSLMLGPVKGKDFATTLGPCMVTPDELEDFRKGQAYDLAMTATVNGQPYSAGSLSDLYWSFEEMISYASRGTTLRPGDVIGSGTVGTGCIMELSLVHGATNFPWLVPGDEVELAVEGIGAIHNTVAAAPPLHKLRPDSPAEG